jgi:2-dehydro-3-deoxyphosphogalactonate aldolase
LFPVGGIRPDNMKGFVDAGANGFGLGSALFTPGLAVAEIAANAGRFVKAWGTIRRDAA